MKTTQGFHKTRLDLILKTWFQLARDETWFFTDAEDPEYKKKTCKQQKNSLILAVELNSKSDKISDGHLQVTHCPPDHSRQALCCKMAAEIDAFFESQKK